MQDLTPPPQKKEEKKGGVLFGIQWTFWKGISPLTSKKKTNNKNHARQTTWLLRVGIFFLSARNSVSYFTRLLCFIFCFLSGPLSVGGYSKQHQAISSVHRFNIWHVCWKCPPPQLFHGDPLNYWGVPPCSLCLTCIGLLRKKLL